VNKSSSVVSLFATLSGLLMLLLSTTVFAVTLAELQQADKLRIKTWVEPADGIIARQQLKLQIEVATDKWFSGGTRIGHFEIKDAIVLQRENFALNSTRTEGDKSWTVQQWTVVVYPQRGGSFEIPPIPLTLSIAGDNFDPISGRTHSQALVFSAAQPEAMQGKDGWVATSRFEVSESFNKPLEELRPGDALKRTINISADNLPAMMLPQIPVVDIPGIAVYNKPAQLVDKVNRGDYLAERIQEITYVFERPGEFEMPAQSYHWWNLETRTAELITLPAQSLVVASLTGQPIDQTESAQPEISVQSESNPALIYKTVVVVVLLLIVLWLIRQWFATRADKKLPAGMPPTASWLLKQAKKASRQHDDEKALSYLYQWMNYDENNQDGVISTRVDKLNKPELRQAYNEVMQAIYSKDKHPADAGRFIEQLVNASSNRGWRHKLFQWDVKLKLN
jgi:hypothetical protein